MRASLAFRLALCAALVLTPLSGCMNKPQSPPKPRIALVMKSLANEFFITMADGAKKHHEQHADQYDLQVDGTKDERDLARQVAMIDELIAQRVAAIVIAPADSRALVSACKRAQQAGIVVINIDNKLDDAVLKEAGITVPFVGPDNRAGARKVGDYLAGKLKPGDPVAILEGVPTAFNGQQRRLGFEDAARAAGLPVVAVQSGQWEMDLANKVAAAILGEHPQVKGLLCGNDSMALGALAAVKAAGKAGQVKVVGFDNISAIREAVQKGDVLATADQHADRLAAYGIEYALKVLNTGEKPADQETPVDLVTAETLPSPAKP